MSALEQAKRLALGLPLSGKQIHADKVDLEYNGEVLNIPNNAVIVCAGGILPTPFLKEIGIEVQTKHGQA